MAKYFSYRNKPTKQKARMLAFMERHKTNGEVSPKKVGKYAQSKGYEIERRGRSDLYDVVNERGTPLATLTVNKRNRVGWWLVH